MIVVFDAECLLCNGWVQFLLRHDTRKKFQFASIQGQTGQALLAKAGLPVENLETLLLVDGSRTWTHTDAIIRVLMAMGGPWRLAQLARIIPARLRDPIYRLLARNRYRVFGRTEVCMRPSPDFKERFLD